VELLASEGAHGAQDTVDNKVDRHSEEEHKCEHRDQERAEKADKREPDLWFRGTGAGGKAEHAGGEAEDEENLYGDNYHQTRHCVDDVPPEGLLRLS